MFKKIRLFINKETSISRSTELIKWVGITLFIHIFFIVIIVFMLTVKNNLAFLLGLIYLVFYLFIILGTLISIIKIKYLYSYLYDTHLYTIKLKKERDMEIAQQKEKALKKQKFLEEEAMKQQQKLDEETAKLRLIQEKEKRKKREKTKRLDTLIKEALSKENAHESLKNFLILKGLYSDNSYTFDNHTKEEWLDVRIQELREEEETLNNSPLTNYFGAVEGGETVLYYLKLENKFGETRYKIGVTLNSVEKRYAGKSGYTILYEKKLTHANMIEKKILEKFNHLVTDESLLGTNGTEIFKEDVLKLDI